MKVKIINLGTRTQIEREMDMAVLTDADVKSLVRLAEGRAAKLWWTDGELGCGLICMDADGVDYRIEDCSLWDAEAHELW